MSTPIYRLKVQSHRARITDHKARKFCFKKPDQETYMQVLS